MSLELEQADREVGLAPLPYWEREIMDIVARKGLAIANHVTPKHVHALVRSEYSVLSNLSRAQLDRAVAKALGVANTAQPAMLDLICKSWGM